MISICRWQGCSLVLGGGRVRPKGGERMVVWCEEGPGSAAQRQRSRHRSAGRPHHGRALSAPGAAGARRGSLPPPLAQRRPSAAIAWGTRRLQKLPPGCGLVAAAFSAANAGGPFFPKPVLVPLCRRGCRRLPLGARGARCGATAASRSSACPLQRGRTGRCHARGDCCRACGTCRPCSSL